MSLRERLRKLVRFNPLNIEGAARTPGWHAPAWNNPAGYEFHEAQRAIEAAYLKLLDIEEQLDQATQSSLANELGAEYSAGGALKTQARFASDEWLAAWQEFLSAVKRAEGASERWHKYMQKKP